MDELGVVRRINDVRRRTRDGEATLIHRQILDQLHLLPREDPDMSTGLATMLAAQGDDTRSMHRSRA